MFRMKIIARHIREHQENSPNPRNRLSEKDLAVREEILVDAKRHMARFGADSFSMAALATGIEVAVSAIIRHFCDMDYLLFKILVHHLDNIARHLAAVPLETANRQAALRAAYVNAIRTGMGGHSEGHTILLRDRHHLPPDLLEQIETRYYHLGEMLGGNFADAVLRVLEIPYQPADLLEQMVAPLLARLATLESAAPSPEPAAPEDWPLTANQTNTRFSAANETETPHHWMPGRANGHAHPVPAPADG
jgi:AcrR family transcriptional regulator